MKALRIRRRKKKNPERWREQAKDTERARGRKAQGKRQRGLPRTQNAAESGRKCGWREKAKLSLYSWYRKR